MSLKVGNSVFQKEMYSMAWAIGGGSKGHRVVVPAKGADTPLYIVMLSPSHLGQSNYVDYMWFLVSKVNWWCSRDFQKKCIAWPR